MRGTQRLEVCNPDVIIYIIDDSVALLSHNVAYHVAEPLKK